MTAPRKPARKRSPLEKELDAIYKKEARLARAAQKAVPPRWKTELEQRVPEKARHGLERAFAKAFALVFDKGTAVIERTYDRRELELAQADRLRAAQDGGGRKELRRLQKPLPLAELALTTAEGVGLGALGIGLPDVVLFVGMLLKGIYQTALHYGFSYDTPAERLFILSMMEAALTSGSAFGEADERVERLLHAPYAPSTEELSAQTRRTADAFAMELLALKFIQGLPLVGALGGAADPVYYHMILRYVDLKYHKRCLLTAKAL